MFCLKFLYEFCFSSLKGNKIKCNTIYNQCAAHYEEAVKTYLKWECPFDCLIVILKQIDLNEYDMNGI